MNKKISTIIPYIVWLIHLGVTLSNSVYNYLNMPLKIIFGEEIEND